MEPWGPPEFLAGAPMGSPASGLLLLSEAALWWATRWTAPWCCLPCPVVRRGVAWRGAIQPPSPMGAEKQ